ncbi:alkaline shock response membrane anchor protein AmaP [Cohnella zeiphila]|uniref:Alkaline shock response membrane anchor protein AmaP n=1 Tax=Cohnella zeiphila TaxID=2761120 RepID=A0A7X0VUQ6_9BACL|nr:alkaline shock response membrane anchor protein AmaP [Cohnella zeiphila]MBB6730522.1 alkaline shock response membrane anchor protein AmaP [Cohnella zeiphila]
MIKVLDRLLMFLYSVAIGAASIVVLVAACGGFDAKAIDDFTADLSGRNQIVQTTVIVVAALLLLVSLRFFIVSVKRNGSSAPSINQKTDHGDIRISVETMENIALKAASRTRGVKDLRARVMAGDAGLRISIRAFVDGETSIPALSEEMQKTVSEQIEETTGIPVAEVSVYIANVTQSPTTYKSRVE